MIQRFRLWLLTILNPLPMEGDLPALAKWLEEQL